MKNKMNYLLSISVILFFIILGVAASITRGKVENQDLSFTVKTNKDNFILGEPIQVEFVVTNDGNKPMSIPKQGVESGSLKIYIAGEEAEYKEYFGSGWGRKMGTTLTLDPGKSHSYYAIILWNGEPNISHLNENAAKQVLAGKITTKYALPVPGVYFIKGVSSISSSGNIFGFKPLRIVVKEPIGDDLEVWNQIKGNREIAFLMQKGGFDTGKEEEKEQLSNRVEQIIERYPNSIYSNYLKPNLEKYKEKEAKREEFYKNVNRQQKP